MTKFHISQKVIKVIHRILELLETMDAKLRRGGIHKELAKEGLIEGPGHDAWAYQRIIDFMEQVGLIKQDKSIPNKTFIYKN